MMKSIYSTLVLFVLLLCAQYQGFAQNWQLVWSDEFTTNYSSDWVFETGAGGWGNSELEYYRQENASVSNGHLVLTAKQESYGGANYTSVRMKTQGKKSWAHGKIEASISVPSFNGAWPAFWMLGDNIGNVGWPACGEIDIMEHINTGNTDYGTIHWADVNGNHVSYSNNTNVSGSITGFHTYTLIWDANSIQWQVDGNTYATANIANGVNNTAAFQKNFFILLNFAIGGNWPGNNIDNGALPANMLVDYVRVYQDNGTVVTGGNNTINSIIQAENYNNMSGVQTESTTDTGGGLDVGYIDTGDWMTYNSINFPTTGNYTVSYRVASPSGGTLSSDLNAGSTQLGSVNIPATGGWQNWTTVTQNIYVTAGTYNFGVYAQSGGWNINWLEITPAHTPPTVSISAPANNASYTAPASITWTANAAASSGSSISKVSYYNGSTLLGSATSSPYSFTWSNVGVGSYSVTAIATDNTGATTTSGAVTITVKAAVHTPPTVSITSPGNNASYTAPASIALAASASATSGSTISKVSYYNGSTLLGTATSSPYSFTWSNVAVGSYSVTAIATDNTGAATTSSAIAITVNSPVTTSGTVIQAESYSNMAGVQTETTTDTGGGLDVGWIDTGDWMAYNSITFPTTGNYIISYRVASVSGGVLSSDLNAGSIQLGTVNVPATGGWQTWTTITQTVSVTAGTYNFGIFAQTGGWNLNWFSIAASTTTGTGVSAPVVTLTSPANNASYNAPATLTMTATASAAGGSITKVAFYNGSTLVGTATSSPYTYSWTNVAAGTYTIKAIATNNAGVTTTSSSATVTVKTVVVSTNSCSGVATYAENNGYTAGSIVQNAGSKYQCKPYPYSGWCNGAAWAYGPGTGSYWTDAWTLLGSCTSARYADDASTNNTVTVSPNPTSGIVNISTPGDATVTIYNSQGNEVVQATQMSINGSLNISNLAPGMYVAKIDTGDNIITRTIIKN